MIQANTHPTAPLNLDLESRIAAQLPVWQQRLQRILRQYGNTTIGQVTVAQVYGGLRGVHALVTEISHVDPYRGIRLRGMTVQELIDELPHPETVEFPLSGGLFFLLLTGEKPSEQEANAVENLWRQQPTLPGYVIDLLKTMPATTHPMTLFSQSLLSMQPNSHAAKAYEAGINRRDIWKPTLQDAIQLTAVLPQLAAAIYNIKYRDGAEANPDPDLDWSANFAHMIGKGDDEQYKDLCRLFALIHADQENGNASAHTAHLVNSTLSDLYYATSAGMNALAGPLHGRANQESLRWLKEIAARFNGLPTREQLKEFAQERLNSGQVIPGYGHGVLRYTDPRFTVQYDFAEKYFPDDPIFQVAKLVYEVIPGVLHATGKVKNPYPNVDAISGTLQHHFGITQREFYTVLFGISRLMGLSVHAVWARALGLAIERPRSLTTDLIEEMVTPFQRPVAVNYHFFD
ncbi:MAG: citrate (Si)-synthase [Anaerolineae bacterium]|jgi:citrate synthase|nr:citrate (Si)-synthase [Anaerolineae bacterium]